MGIKPIQQYKLEDRNKYIKRLEGLAPKQLGFYFKIKQSIKRGRSPIVAVFGEPRSGKTENAITWAWLLKPNFKVPDDIFTDVEKLIEYIDDKNIRNRALILDEAQKDLDIGAWNTLLGRALVKYNGSQAIRKNILFIIMPYARWLPWIQQPAINFIIDVQGQGWATYYVHKTRTADFSGKSFKMTLGFSKLPRMPEEIIKLKETWEVPAKRDYLKEIRAGIKPKRKTRAEYFQYLEERQKQINRLKIAYGEKKSNK